MMMGAGMFWVSFLSTVLLLGFAYIIWVLSAKEAGGVKTAGQVIAIIIAVLALLVLLYSGIYGGMMGRGWCGKDGKGYSPMMGPGRHMMSPEERQEYFQKFMQEYKK